MTRKVFGRENDAFIEPGPAYRRVPRSLDEAFGPHCSKSLEEPNRPMDRADKIVLWGCVVALAVLGFLAQAGVI